MVSDEYDFLPLIMCESVQHADLLVKNMGVLRYSDSYVANLLPLAMNRGTTSFVA
jgi:hypothetical protein